MAANEPVPFPALSAISAGVDIKALILAAHPDDETIAVGGHLWAWPSASVVHLTRGAPRDPHFAKEAGFSTPEAYAEARTRELDAALQVASIAASHHQQLDYTDQETCFRLPNIVRDVTALIERLQPAVIITHPYEGGHPDHDSAAFAAQTACRWLAARARNVPVIVEAAFYHHAQSSLAICEFIPFAGFMELELELDASQRAAKHDMFACYESQRTVLAQFPTDRERFRLAPAYDFEQAPHAGPLNYECMGWPVRGASWREHARSTLGQLGLLPPIEQNGSALASKTAQ